jgi:uncharacterized protein (DUF1330 family)
MATVIVRHRVEDYEKWRPVFDEHGANRKEHGCTSETVLRDAEEPNEVAIVMAFPTLDDAHAFGADPSLPDAMGRGGVIGAPRVEFYEEAGV